MSGLFLGAHGWSTGMQSQVAKKHMWVMGQIKTIWSLHPALSGFNMFNLMPVRFRHFLIFFVNSKVAPHHVAGCSLIEPHCQQVHAQNDWIKTRIYTPLHWLVTIDSVVGDIILFSIVSGLSSITTQSSLHPPSNSSCKRVPFTDPTYLLTSSRLQRARSTLTNKFQHMEAPI